MGMRTFNMMMMAAMMMGGDYGQPTRQLKRTTRERKFGQSLPGGLRVFETEVEAEEDMKCKFLVAAINQGNADKKFNKLFSDLLKLKEEKGDNVLEEDIVKIKRKHFKYFDYEHVL